VFIKLKFIWKISAAMPNHRDVFVVWLQEQGHDAMYTLDLDLTRRRALKNGLTVVTIDDDFSQSFLLRS